MIYENKPRASVECDLRLHFATMLIQNGFMGQVTRSDKEKEIDVLIAAAKKLADFCVEILPPDKPYTMPVNGNEIEPKPIAAQDGCGAG